MERYYKNLILCGDADYYCLICRETFILKETVERHLRWENHRKKIKAQDYFPKYRKNSIYKIENVFYCETCNIVTSDPNEHIKCDDHKNAKASNTVRERVSVIERGKTGAIVINGRVISLTQWHTILNKMCFVCDESFTSLSDHLTSFTHMVKFIQSESVRKNDQYFRKVSIDKYVCYICSDIFQSLPEEHACITFAIATKEVKKEKVEAKSIMDLLKEAYSDAYDFDDANKLAACRKCGKLVLAEYRPLVKHKNRHRPKEYIDHGKRRAELKIYGKDHHFKLNEGGTKGYCSICHIQMPGHMAVLKQHIAGRLHRDYLEFKGLAEGTVEHERPGDIGVPFEEFLKEKDGPHLIKKWNMIVLNKEICLEFSSYSFIKNINNFSNFRHRCFLCDVALCKIHLDHRHRKEKCAGCESTFSKLISDHVNSNKHAHFVRKCKVYTMNLHDAIELVREIRPHMYHCGYCNKMYPYWENMDRHLHSVKHKDMVKRNHLLQRVCYSKALNPNETDLMDIPEYGDLQRYL